MERTDPSFDVTALLNGYEPLFSLLNPRDADNLTKGVLESLQGDTASITTLITQTSTLTEAFAGRDQALGDVITNLNKVVGNLAVQNDDLDGVITQTREVVAALDQRRPELQASMGALARMSGNLAKAARDDYPRCGNSSIGSRARPGMCSTSNLKWPSWVTTCRWHSRA